MGISISKDEFYVACLLHDIGKFIYNVESKLPEHISRPLKNVSDGCSREYAHRHRGANFIEYLYKETSNSIFSNGSLSIDVIKRLILSHHTPRGDDGEKCYKQSELFPYDYILRVADWLASSERLEYDEKEGEEHIGELQLRNILSVVSIKGQLDSEKKTKNDNCFWKVKELSYDDFDIGSYIGDKLNKDIISSMYEKLWRSFWEDVKKVDNEEKLFFILQKYMSFIPAQHPFKSQKGTSLYIPDISLYDHLRMVASIGYCLFRQYEAKKLDNSVIENIKGSKDILKDKNKKNLEFGILIYGDFSGIQNFIFNIKSSGATKNLKARSLFLEILSEVIIRFLLDRLTLKEANVLYNGGGNFFIMAPLVEEENLKRAIKDIEKSFYESLEGELFLAIDYVPITLGDFLREEKGKPLPIIEKMEILRKKANYHKKRKFLDSDINIFKNNDISLNLKEKLHEDFIKFYNRIRNSKFFVIAKEKSSFEAVNENNLVFRLFKSLGYDVFRKENSSSEYSHIYTINSVNFIEEGADGFIFMNVDVPRDDKGEILEFESIAYDPKNGDKKLGIVKLDVDNLGYIFQNGISYKEQSISRYATLSSVLKLFFTAYINRLRKKYEDKGKKVYIVYAGGDDSFIIANWYTALSFVRDLYNAFKEFSCCNKDVNISAGVVFTHSKFPIYLSSEEVENSLEMAKSYLVEDKAYYELEGFYKSEEAKNYLIEGKEDCETVSAKNRISIFKTPLEWKDFREISTSLIDKAQNEPYSGKLSLCGKEVNIVNYIERYRGFFKKDRSIIFKLYKIIPYIESIKKGLSSGKVKPSSIWKLYYILRPRNEEDNGRNIEKDLLRNLETALKNAISSKLKGKKDSWIKLNKWVIMLRIIELLTREVEEKKDEV